MEGENFLSSFISFLKRDAIVQRGKSFLWAYLIPLYMNHINEVHKGNS